MPIYTFHVFSQTTSTPEKIEIIKGEENNLWQKIEIGGDISFYDTAAEWFNAQDINFDGYLDIGLRVDGGAKWGAFQYWTFDPKTEKFVESEIAKEFRNIGGYNEIKFDKENKKIITNNFCGTLVCEKKIYLVKNRHLKLIEEYNQKQEYQKSEPFDTVKSCTITSKKYLKNKVDIKTEVINDYCVGYFNLELAI